MPCGSYNFLLQSLETASCAFGKHAFTVLGGNRYQEIADKKSWKRFTEFLTDTLKN